VIRNKSGLADRSSLLPFFLLLFASCCDAQVIKTEIVGHWVAVNRSQGGIGSMWEFKTDGTLTMAPGAVVDMPYKIDGDKLILPPTTTGADAKPLVVSFRIQGNTLYQSSPDNSAAANKEGKFVRVSTSKPGDQPIVGTWKPAEAGCALPADQQYREVICALGRNATFTYTKDGVCKLRMPFKFIAGTYTAKDSSSGAFTVTSRPGTVFTYRVAQGKLYLSQPPNGKTEDVYERDDIE
jgi:hypothetical protein